MGEREKRRRGDEAGLCLSAATSEPPSTVAPSYAPLARNACPRSNFGSKEALRACILDCAQVNTGSEDLAAPPVGEKRRQCSRES